MQAPPAGTGGVAQADHAIVAIADSRGQPVADEAASAFTVAHVFLRGSMVWIVCLGLLGAILAGAVAGAWKWWILAQAGVDPSTLPAFQLLFDVMNLHWPALAGGGVGAVIGALLSRLTRPPPAAPAPPPLERELQYVHFRGEADDNIHAGQRQRADEWLARHGRDRQDDDDPR